jgi:hypothetical protein
MPFEGAASPTARHHGVAMALLLIVVALYGSLLDDRIPIRQGRGWDGNIYVTVAADLKAGWEMVSKNPYRFQRIVPSLIVNAGLVATGAPRDDGTVLAAFMVLNTALLMLTLWLWLAVADHLRLSLAARWLGFVGLFINVPCLKIAYYYPALTDIAALALGMALIYLFLTGRTVALALTVLVGAFTWPVSGPMGALLVLFPGGVSKDQPEQPTATPVSLAARWVAAVAALAVTVMVGHLFYARGIRTAGWGPIVPAVESVYPLSLLVTAAYVFIVVASLVPEPTPAGLRAAFQRMTPVNAAMALAIIVLPRLAVSTFTSGIEVVNIKNFIPYTFFLSTTRPGIFLVGHLIYFGPVLLLLPFVWKALRGLLQQWGPGAQLYLILGLMVAACPDSRQSMLIVPMLIVALVYALEQTKRVTNGLVISLGTLALLMSRFWLRFSLPSSAPPASPLEAGWDMSRYYETQGSYMTEPFYLSGLALGGLCLFLLNLELTAPARRSAPATKASDPGT